MENIAPFWRFAALLPAALLWLTPAQGQTQTRLNSITIDGKDVNIHVQEDTKDPPRASGSNGAKGLSALFPVAPPGLGTHASGASSTPAVPAKRQPNAVTYAPSTDAVARPPLQTQDLPSEDKLPDFVVPPLALLATNIKPTATPKIRWLLFQSSERSANTGQLTCLGWARSINLAKALESEGPFHAAVASASVREDLAVGTVWNNSAEATMIPLASKWDAPVWAQAPADAPMGALSALYQFSKNAKGSANIAVSWDAEYLERFQASWFEGLVKSGDVDGLQAFSWKQKIRKWSANDKSRIDVLEYTVEGGKIKNVQWRTMNLRNSGPNYGCPTS